MSYKKSKSREEAAVIPHDSYNIFHELKRRDSILYHELYGKKENFELLNIGAQAPSPSKDYCQLIVTQEKIIYRWWKITLRGDSDNKYPGEIKDTYEDFIHDEIIQREIVRVFGRSTFNYVNNIVEKGRLDCLARLREKILLKIISFLNLEDIARLSQVNRSFRHLCRSDKVWFDLYAKYYHLKEVSRDLAKLAERDGWRKLFFTNKIKLQLELRRQARSLDNENYWRGSADNSLDSIYFTPRRPAIDKPIQDSTLTYRRSTKSAAKKKSNQKNYKLNDSIGELPYFDERSNRFS